MKVLIQRVRQASVAVNEEEIGKIERGLLLFVAFGSEDDESKLKPMAQKIANLRIFPDEKGRFHLSLLDISGGVLAVPNFTLFGDTSKGRRPEFFGALDPEQAALLFEKFVSVLKATGLNAVEKGDFGAYMQVSLLNDGPVTMMLEN